MYQSNETLSANALRLGLGKSMSPDILVYIVVAGCEAMVIALLICRHHSKSASPTRSPTEVPAERAPPTVSPANWQGSASSPTATEQGLATGLKAQVADTVRPTEQGLAATPTSSPSTRRGSAVRKPDGRSEAKSKATQLRGPARARQRALPFAELYVQWHEAHHETGVAVARDDIWHFAHLFAACSGKPLPKRDNFFWALKEVRGVEKLLHERVAVKTKEGCPIKKQIAYRIEGLDRQVTATLTTQNRRAA